MYTTTTKKLPFFLTLQFNSRVFPELTFWEKLKLTSKISTESERQVLGPVWLLCARAVYFSLHYLRLYHQLGEVTKLTTIAWMLFWETNKLMPTLWAPPLGRNSVNVLSHPCLLLQKYWPKVKSIKQNKSNQSISQYLTLSRTSQSNFRLLKHTVREHKCVSWFWVHSIYRACTGMQT